MFLSTSLQSSGLQDFLKCLLSKLSATRTLRLCRSLCLRHLREIVFILSPPCSPTLCVTFICSRLTLSLQIPEKPQKPVKHVTLSPFPHVTLSPITLSASNFFTCHLLNSSTYPQNLRYSCIILISLHNH